MGIAAKDFSFLTKPENFHPLPLNTVPQAFLVSPNAPPSDATVEQLLENGQFYAAAITSAQAVTRLPRPIDANTVFSLLETRLKCLLLINQTTLAAVESKMFGDLSNPFYQDPVTGKHIVPWDLRVLCIRLQALGFGEWRRGIMAYYMLAQEARHEIALARRDTSQYNGSLWTARLQDVGIRVGSALVEMGDSEAAARHLRGLELDARDESERNRLLQMQTLVWLKLGDVRAAQRCVRRILGVVSTPASPTIASAPWSSDEEPSADRLSVGTLVALLKMGEGDFAGAADAWQLLLRDSPNDAMLTQNLAICLLYTHRLVEARELLENALQDGHRATFKSLLFNLCTIYELCTEMAIERKTALSAQIAALSPTEEGWDKAASDFKL